MSKDDKQSPPPAPPVPPAPPAVPLPPLPAPIPQVLQKEDSKKLEELAEQIKLLSEKLEAKELDLMAKEDEIAELKKVPPAALSVTQIIGNQETVHSKQLCVQVIKDFAFPANGYTKRWEKGYIVEDPILAQQMLDCGVPVKRLSDKDVNVCPNCSHVFSK